MSRFLIFFGVLLVLLFTSCGTSKRASETASVQKKLDTQFQLYKGVKYKYGGADKRGFDCSGFVQTAYSNAFNIQLPRTTKAMAELGTKVSKSRLRSGDLVFFRPSRKYRHVGIFIGNNTFMHSSTSKGIIKSNLDNVYWKKKYRFAKRIIKSKK